MALAAVTISPSYAQHRPERTLLYEIVSQHLETFLDEARTEYARGLPKYVERELRAYLACGIHAHGFLRARCRQCKKELLAAFSCKKRGICPSCNARRMCGTAAHLVDHGCAEKVFSPTTRTTRGTTPIHGRLWTHAWKVLSVSVS